MAFDFQRLGRDSCASANAQISTITQHLNVVYNEFLKEEKLDIEGIKQRINALKAEVTKIGNAIHNYNAGKKNLTDVVIPRIEADITNTQNSIDKLEEDGGETPPSKYLPLVIGAFITICLTLFLFVFYSSTAYSTYFGVNCKQGIIDFNAFSKASNKGGLVLTLITLFPMIFLGLGFLIHDALKEKKILFIAFMLIITLIVDFIIGYKITNELYQCQYNTGNDPNMQPWQFSMIFSDSNFYLVLASGFAAYVLWGALLNYTLTKLEEIEPNNVIQRQLEQLHNRLEELKSDLDTNKTNVNEIDAKIQSNQANADVLIRQINAFESGGIIPVDVPRLKAKTGEFMQGWVAYIELMFPQTAGNITNQSIEESNNWLNQKIQSL